METVVAAYENSVRFYFPKDTTTEAVLDVAFWNEVDTKVKHLCRDLAKELSREYSVTITTSVGQAGEK